MMQQVLDLSPPLPAAPKRAPRSTSAEAIADLEHSGRLGDQQRKVLRGLELYGHFDEPTFDVPLTSAQLSHLFQMDRYAVARRLPELARQGLVERVGEVVCSISGRRATSWQLTAAGVQAVRELL